MTKLLEHFQAMQGMATRYITQEVYKSREGTLSAEENKRDNDEFRKALFISDLLYMLDGPEQREAEKAEAARQAEYGDLRLRIQELEDQVAVSRSDAKRATDAIKAERDATNLLRDRLMTSELAYAKLAGYLEGKRDSAPPVMVPQQREHFYAQMPDGTQGSGWDYRPTEAKWWHR